MNLMDILSADPPSSIYGSMEDLGQNGGSGQGLNTLADTVIQDQFHNSSQEAEDQTVAAAAAAAVAVGGDDQQLNFSQQQLQQHQAHNPTRHNSSGVYHIPTQLSKLQIALTKILLHLISEPLINQSISKEKKKNTIDSLLEVSTMQSTLSLSPDNGHQNANDGGSRDLYKLFAFCFEKLCVINNHPSLLVDHFMPRKLLLSEPNESQISMSGKLELFNKIVDGIIDAHRHRSRNDRDQEKEEEKKKEKEQRKNKEKTQGKQKQLVSILVVAKSNKELELIEGMIIGKDLQYHNSSNMRLYDDKRKRPFLRKKDDKERGRAGGADEHENNDDSDNDGDDNDNDDNDQHHDKGVHASLFINLIQTRQLYNNYMNSSTSSIGNYKFIFSFDFDIDPSNPSIEMLRSSHNCPIYVPVPIFSIEHLKLCIPEPRHSNFDDGGDELHRWRLKVLNTMVVNMYNLESGKYSFRETFYRDIYGIKMSKYVAEVARNPIEFSNRLGQFDEELTLNFSLEKLKRKLESMYNIKVNGVYYDNGRVLTVENIKSQLVEAIQLEYLRIRDELDRIEHKEVPLKRSLETARQVHFDEDEDSIQASYKKLRKLNEQASILDKRLARFENDIDKNQEKLYELECKEDELIRNTSGEDSKEGFEQVLLNQRELLSRLEKELGDLQTEMKKVSDDADDARQDYQQNSSQAVLELKKLEKIKEQRNKLYKKINGPGMAQLPDLIRRDTLINYEQRLTRLVAQNKFLNSFYDGKIDRIYVERQHILENNGGPSGSSSRPSNRISRDSTPF
ncbi:histone deacetylase [Lodderomyces elongisporus]|uniref:histone deacetylase n=1 Tax=Lodderomyces elongisporus TaxID=36914 RepID=UPI002922AA7A|nr:histone deacetylase [Lodderomyces elongisporus]WLF79874.1 histone deacetylase [Lodderomyces elongisporus]